MTNIQTIRLHSRGDPTDLLNALDGPLLVNLLGCAATLPSCLPLSLLGKTGIPLLIVLSIAQLKTIKPRTKETQQKNPLLALSLLQI